MNRTYSTDAWRPRRDNKCAKAASDAPQATYRRAYGRSAGWSEKTSSAYTELTIYRRVGPLWGLHDIRFLSCASSCQKKYCYIYIVGWY